MASHFNIVQRLQEKALRQPDQLALIQPATNGVDITLTYNELLRLSQGYANLFKAKGLTSNDTALLLIPPSPDFYAVFLGLMQLGITALIIDPGVGSGHVRACLNMVRPTAFMGTAKAQLLRLYPELKRPLKAFCTSAFPFTPKLKSLHNAFGTQVANTHECAENHPALITFTSGSTGKPKAIVRTHGFLLRQGDALSTLMHSPQDTVELCTFPVFVLANLAQGITTLLPPAGTQKLSTANFAQVLQSMEKYHATRLLAAPDFCLRLALESSSQKVLHRLYHIHTGGGPVHINVLFHLQKASPNATIMALYGSTEAEPIALQNLSTLTKQDLSRIAQGAGLPAGHPVDIIQLRIIEDQTGQPINTLSKAQFNQITLPQGSIGEIVVTGPLVQKGYMNKMDDIETKFETNGEIWHRTGDAGYLDAQGKLWLQGRCNAKIKLDNHDVYPFAIEAAAAMHPQIKKAAFVQINSENILVLEGAALTEKEEALLKRNFKFINKITYLSSIPVDKRHHTKVLYAELKKLLQC